MFTGKIVVITGSTQGIGKRTAELLASRGAKIVINSRNQNKVSEAVEEFENKGFDVLGVSGDVSNYDFCVELRNKTIERFGKIDYLINNAALAAKGALSDTHHTVFEKVYTVNVLGSLFPSKAFIEDLKQTQGGILFISSYAAVVGLPGYIAYSSTKRAIASIAESLKNELVDDGIFIGVNYPGFTENDVNKTILHPSGREDILQKRVGVKLSSLDKTAGSIMRQLENRNFRSYSSIKGRFIQFTYDLFPRLSLFLLRLNRRRIMKMD